MNKKYNSELPENRRCRTVSEFAERLRKARLGALGGAVVAGPFGLIAGGVVGYTAGPGIASEWGLRHVHHSREWVRAFRG